MSKVDPKATTYGEIYGPAMKITDPEDAKEYLASLIEKHMKDHGTDEAAANYVVSSNLGYYAGYYDRETMIRVEELFGSVHPIIGSVKEHEPTPEELFEMGKNWVESNKT